MRYYLGQSPLAHVPIASVTKGMVAEYQRSLFSKGLAHTTVLSVIRGTLGPMMAAAVEDGVIAESPAHRLRWPRHRQPEPDPFTPRERERIFRWYKRHQSELLLFVGLVFLAGLRPSEAAGLRAADFNRRTGAVFIQRALTDLKVGDPKTRKSRRRIVLGRRVRRLVEARIAERIRADEYLCVVNGAPINSETWGGKNFRRCLEDLGLYRKGKSIYRGRHTYVSAAAVRAPLPVVAAYCGTSVVQVERHYLRVLEELRDPLEG